ncbi:hypothetical protein [Bosea sp. BK604]|uniref:hypothetical protein n=1 Tax=Bosea sp. BK604 TaxID=2512180 RepID=UPI00104E9575|nr:hypothetical protein [Bosea sp. BK604]TCR64690.1 hypothetical protein EV560_106156 [Bosea sp. BK604]
MGARGYTFDALLQLKDAGAITSSAAAQVGGQAKILDMGAGRFDGTVVVNVSAIDIVSNDEEYNIIIQGSNSSSFASGIENLAMLNLGATEVRDGGAQDSVPGQYEIGVTNEQADTVYRYIRAYTFIAGSSTTPSINYTAFLSNDAGR